VSISSCFYLLARRAGHVDYGLERGFRLARAIEQQRIIRAVRDRIAVRPVHAVVHTPKGHSIDGSALAIEDAEELCIPIGELLLHVRGQSVLVGIEEALELGELELRMHHALPDDLSFLRERQDVDVEL